MDNFLMQYKVSKQIYKQTLSIQRIQFLICLIFYLFIYFQYQQSIISENEMCRWRNYNSEKCCFMLHKTTKKKCPQVLKLKLNGLTRTFSFDMDDTNSIVLVSVLYIRKDVSVCDCVSFAYLIWCFHFKYLIKRCWKRNCLFRLFIGLFDFFFFMRSFSSSLTITFSSYCY